MLATMNNDLHVFVRDALARGLSREQVASALRDARWPDDEIESALAAWHDAGIGLPVPRRRVGVSPREAFLHLVLFVSLYLVAYHVGAILFALIERTWPDPLAFGGDPRGDRLREMVRFSTATLLVALPVHLFVARATGRAIAADPERRTSGPRRWLTWITLFVAACVLIGDFIAVVFGLLRGQLTATFLARAAVVGVIAGWMFTHYMGGQRHDEGGGPRLGAAPLLARVAALVAVVATVLGLWLAGAPDRVRVEQLDRLRLRDLDALAQAVQRYRAEYGTPPADLTELVSMDPHADLRLADPVTGDRYAFVLADSTAFELCATFERADSLGPTGDRPSLFWRHEAGRACFRFRFPVVAVAGRRAAPPAPGGEGSTRE
jgi:hypothetical protein